MLTQPITYKNWDDVEVTKDFHFNLTRSELVRLELSEQDGLAEALSKIVKEGNARLILATFERIILGSYGVREGDDFRKTEAFTEKFKQSPAYDALFMLMVTDANFASTFIKGILPEIVNAAGEPIVARGIVDVPVGPGLDIGDLSVDALKGEIAKRMQNIQQPAVKDEIVLEKDFLEMSTEEFQALKERRRMFGQPHGFFPVAKDLHNNPNIEPGTD